MSLPSSGNSSYFSSSSLHCPEDGSFVGLPSISHQHSLISSTIPPPQSPPSDEITVSSLIDSETHHMPLHDYLHRCRRQPLLLTARQDSINWILRVHAHFHFRPVTAMLSVNYFDRFLSSHSLPEASGWPFQLLSVACLSLAAKMEEPQVPSLSDLQIFEPRFFFEPKTVQRMELRVMSVLNWRLKSVTPFHFLPYFISKLPSSSSTSVFPSSSDLILRTIRAAAAVLRAAGESLVLPTSIDERVNKEMVRSCHQLMGEFLTDTCSLARFEDGRAEQQAVPPSPIGVLDAAACGSCDTRSENPGSSSQVEAKPFAKRLPSSPLVVQEP
ncbi:cyclin-D1-1-like isoform X2 [Mangifera indica]|uniref:cyclin-D1-1-like isoform X2 n=1 Tax=Mangifera indica TaxID=29780 RepID=UPI001CFB3E40|nr:cyclin-D1-1-like isoform X2 [Mangifera indica]